MASKLSLIPDLCHAHDWNPIAAASAQSSIAAVLAGFVFAGIVVVLSVRAHSLKRESALALKLLFTAFFGLAVTAYLLADLAGEQTCPRAETTEALAGSALGAFAVITITALTWLVVAYQRHDDGVLKFLHGLVYVSCAFVILLICTNATSYLSADLPSSTVASGLPIYLFSGLSILGGAVWIWRRHRSHTKEMHLHEASTTGNTAVNFCAWSALTYLAVTSVATGVEASLPPRMWYPSPEPWAIYLAAWASVALPLAVLGLAINALARTPSGDSKKHGHLTS